MLNLDTKLYRSEITKHSAKCLKQLKRGAAPTVPVPSSKAPINALFGWNYIFDWSLFLVFKLICEHCKFEQMNKTFCDRTHVNRMLYIFAAVNLDCVFSVFSLSCALLEIQ